MNKRFISFVMSLSILCSMVVALPMKASAASYSVNNAIAYAQSHWNDGKGLCAEFVADCVMAGGVNTGTIRTVKALWPKICSLTGLSKIDLALDSKGTFNPQSSIKRSEVAAILSRMMDEGARKEFSLY